MYVQQRLSLCGKDNDKDGSGKDTLVHEKSRRVRGSRGGRGAAAEQSRTMAGQSSQIQLSTTRSKDGCGVGAMLKMEQTGIRGATQKEMVWGGCAWYYACALRDVGWK